MTLELHHLHLGQSERIIWLLEEMQVPYDLVVHERNPKTGLAPEDLKSITPAGTAPFFRDTSVQPPVSLTESGAIIQYILEVYGPSAPGTRMYRKPGDPDYAQYIDWLHISAVSMMSSQNRMQTLLFTGAMDSPIAGFMRNKFTGGLARLDQHLSQSKWLAGDEVSAADCMIVTGLTTLRGYFPYDLGPYPNILRYLKDVAARPAYKEAIRKGDRDMRPMIEPKEKAFVQFEDFRPVLEKADGQP